jgi:ATP-dependent RNA helicase DeaD
VDYVSNKLMERGYTAQALHGDIQQKQRERILTQFKKKTTTILVATDVAARGIDVQDISHIINYALPQDPESYIHRVGRTGRAGKT